jgi:hypothetical protein
MLKQVSIFAENKAGRVHAIMKSLKEAQINVRAMTIAETSEFGIVRLIVDNPESAKLTLKNAGFTAKITDVIGVTVSDEFGALNNVLKILGEKDISIEYMYSLMRCPHGNANILIRVSDCEKATAILTEAGVKMFTQDDLTS